MPLALSLCGAPVYPFSATVPLFFCLVDRSFGSSLFPYTTLFRSVLARPWLPARPWLLAGDHRRPRAGHRHRWPADRKSTRLNSSHLGISYAVFCLKKKNMPVAVTLDSETVYIFAATAQVPAGLD